MSPLIVFVISLTLLAVLAAAAFWAWLQIAREVIADEGDDADKDSGGAPAIPPELEQTLWYERSGPLRRAGNP